MNPHYQSGPPAPPNMHNQHFSRRQHEYHQTQYPNPVSPNGYTPYPYQYAPQYYHQPMPAQYQMPRWTPQQPYMPYGMPPPMHNPQMSPMIAQAQPHMPPNPRAPAYVQAAPVVQSPYSAHQANSSTTTLSQAISSPRELPSKTATPQPSSRRPSSVVQPPPPPTARIPFYPELPCYFPPESQNDFPGRATRPKRRLRLQAVVDGVLLPSRTTEEPGAKDEQTRNAHSADVSAEPLPREIGSSQSNGLLVNPTPVVSPEAKEELQKHRRSDTRTIAPVIPALPHIPAARPKSSDVRETGITSSNGQTTNEAATVPSDTAATPLGSGEQSDVVSPKIVPKSWADLVRIKGAAAASHHIHNGPQVSNGVGATRNGTMAEVLKHFDVSDNHKLPFLEPRGLVNTGNMCYMNSILQVLVFCIPFYDFLDQVGKRAAHSFKSDTPLIDAMIMFMREFKVIDTAESAERLQLRLKDGELEQYGDSLMPEYVYSVINQLPRFSSMRRGHQQDAEEFLGFLLAGLHDECVAVTGSQPSTEAPEVPTSPTSGASNGEANGWMEVGPKQRAAITRQSGDPSASSPLTRIFGGALRSELRVPGLKNSVTLEPYQPLQLDIGTPGINSITDALKGLTKPETLTGDFNSPRGPGTTATKQVFIESLPPVLILHLKRFQYDSSGGTQKIWKRIGYPLELELPKEVFPPSKRASMAIGGGSPRYRLTAVVYHHGKSAAGGHYTVDLLRQDKREWVRLDDTYIRRIRPEDVAEAGAEEDPKVLAKALEHHQQQQDTTKQNLYDRLDGEDDTHDEGKWSDVNGNDHKKRWAGVAAGTATPSTTGKRTPKRDSVKDNKVAYILLYEKV